LENERRKHNYIPLILEIFKTAASKGQLAQLIENARKKQAQQ
jgi:ubiquitin carboxyl-terminal hydrolase L5